MPPAPEFDASGLPVSGPVLGLPVGPIRTAIWLAAAPAPAGTPAIPAPRPGSLEAFQLEARLGSLRGQLLLAQPDLERAAAVVADLEHEIRAVSAALGRS